jgi:maltooligosyltrehalose trehalohydrolase
VAIVLEQGEDGSPHEIPLTAEHDGYFSGVVPEARAGNLYRYRLDDSESLLPDPASRFQPHGPHGASEIIDPTAFEWTDSAWRGVSLAGQVLYELHLGTFTQAGTFQSATDQLPRLAALGITVIELLPLAEFPGRFGWGYDGVDLYAPTRLYGRPDDVRRFVDRAHALGLAVILDVVYNHFGPDGNYLGAYAPEYFSTRHTTEWGQALNYDGEHSGPVREFMAANAAYWIDEFHFDGLRFDATQQIFDSSPRHILADMQERARAAAPGRGIILFAESETQESRIVRAIERGGFGFDGLWNDDFHHAATVALSGHREAYYTDYQGSAQEFLSLTKWGFLYQGQRYKWQRKRRGSPALDLEPAHFVTFLQNHDQVANMPSGRGRRLHEASSPGAYRAMTAFWLLSPGTPMFFQGQEFGASTPFLFFADHGGELGASVRTGRGLFMSQFRNLSTPDVLDRLPDPLAEETFLGCKLDDPAGEPHEMMLALHRDLLALRRQDPVVRLQGENGIDGSILAASAFVLRFFAAPPGAQRHRDGGRDRLLLVNLGPDILLDPAPDPLLAPPADHLWQVRWSSEDPAYGGCGLPLLLDTDENWRIPGFAAVLLSGEVP